MCERLAHLSTRITLRKLDPRFIGFSGSIDLDIVIMALVLGGLLHHWRPAAHIAAIKHAAQLAVHSFCSILCTVA